MPAPAVYLAHPQGSPACETIIILNPSGFVTFLSSVDRGIPRLVSEQSVSTQEQLPKFRTKQLPNI